MTLWSSPSSQPSQSVSSEFCDRPVSKDKVESDKYIPWQPLAFAYIQIQKMFTEPLWARLIAGGGGAEDKIPEKQFRFSGKSQTHNGCPRNWRSQLEILIQSKVD